MAKHGRRVSEDDHRADAIFGEGTIVDVIGAGRTMKLHIRFDRAGRKTIAPRYAQLRLMS